MRYAGAIALALLVGACGSRPAPAASPAPAPAPVARCDDYALAVGDASRTPGAVDVQAVTACGCGYTITTTAAAAARVTSAHDARTRDGCGTVNCDTPCTAMVLPGAK